MSEVSNIIEIPPDTSYAPDPRGIAVALQESMQKHNQNIAQIDAKTGETQTYDQILLKSIQLAINIKRKGITKTDIILLCASNTLEACLPMYASIFLGTRIATLDPTLDLNDMKHMITLTKPRLIFCEHENADTISKITKTSRFHSEIIVFGHSQSAHVQFSTLLINHASENQFEVAIPTNLTDTVVILFSSGTTGLPKGICLNHYGLMTQQHNLLQGHDINVCLSFTTLYWISAIILFVMCSLNGTTRLLCRKFDENTIMGVLEKFKVSLCFMAPMNTYLITNVRNNINYDTSALKTIIIGGGRLENDQYKLLKTHFPHTNMFNTYGMTEMHGLITIFHPERDQRFIGTKLGSCGRPAPGISYKIVNVDTGEILGANQTGEIRLKSDLLTMGYYENRAETLASRDVQGFLHTGDIGYYDEDNCFYVIDRIKELIKYQSWHILPMELESILLTHPAIKEAVVIGIPHQTDGEHPMGVIELYPDSTITEHEIITYFNARVGHRKKLRSGIKIVDSIPRTPAGKLKRRDLKALLI